MIIILNCKVIQLRAKKKNKKIKKIKIKIKIKKIKIKIKNKKNKQTNIIQVELDSMTIPKYPNSKLLIWVPNKQTTKVSYQTYNYNA